MADNNSGLAAQITPINCPCCHQYVPVPSLEIVVDRYQLSPMQSRILYALWKARGFSITRERIFDAMYVDDPDGGPSEHQMANAFKNALHYLRGRLENSGFSIETVGYGRGYRLQMGVN